MAGGGGRTPERSDGLTGGGTFIRATDSYWPEDVWARVHDGHEFIRSSSSYCPEVELAKMNSRTL